jgi:hypothetical protein
MGREAARETGQGSARVFVRFGEIDFLGTKFPTSPVRSGVNPEKYAREREFRMVILGNHDAGKRGSGDNSLPGFCAARLSLPSC